METADTVPELELLEPLVSPFGPVVTARPTVTNPRRGLADLTYIGVSVGSGAPGAPIRGTGMNSVTTGGGKAVGSPARARLIAIAEGAERYAAGNFLGEPRILASPADMTGRFIGPDRIPRCSERELSVPGSIIRALDPNAAIRWSLGTDLATGDPIWVPSVMAAYGVHDLLPSERFWYGISTGFAVHFDPIEALVGGIFEVIERDANAILWLQRLRLPLIAEQDLSPATEYLLDWSTRHFVDTYLFDATTDLGVPTVYCLQIADYDSRARHVVGAAAARDIRSAAEKALMEAVGATGVFYMDQEVKEDFASFSGVLDGARYIGQAAPGGGFQFPGRRSIPARRPRSERTARESCGDTFLAPFRALQSGHAGGSGRAHPPGTGRGRPRPRSTSSSQTCSR